MTDFWEGLAGFLIFALILGLPFATFLWGESNAEKCCNRRLKLAGIERLVEHKTVVDWKVTTNWCEIIWLKK